MGEHPSPGTTGTKDTPWGLRFSSFCRYGAVAAGICQCHCQVTARDATPKIPPTIIAALLVVGNDGAIGIQDRRHFVSIRFHRYRSPRV